MNKEAVCARIEEIGIIPAVRLSSEEDALFAAEAVCSSGIPIVEVTMTVPGAVEVIHSLTGHGRVEVVVGAGSIPDVDTAKRCVDAGAKFLTSTGLDLGVVEFGVKNHVCVFPGALTPTEVMMARNSGADFVKLFPCSAVGGAHYVRALRGPFPQVRFIAAGGVNQATLGDFISAGAVAVGIGSELIHHDAIRRRERDWIRELSRRYLGIIRQTREERSQAQ